MRNKQLFQLGRGIIRPEAMKLDESSGMIEERARQRCTTRVRIRKCRPDLVDHLKWTGLLATSLLLKRSCIGALVEVCMGYSTCQVVNPLNPPIPAAKPREFFLHGLCCDGLDPSDRLKCSRTKRHCLPLLQTFTPLIVSPTQAVKAKPRIDLIPFPLPKSSRIHLKSGMHRSGVGLV